MADKTHCDGCDVVIHSTVEHLRVRPSLWTGDRGIDPFCDDFDFCSRCVEKNPALKKMASACADSDGEEEERLRRIAASSAPRRAHRAKRQVVAPSGPQKE